MIVNPKDPIVRYAILEAHGFRCYYSNRWLNMFNATVDHIIPQSYEGKLDELNEYKKALGIDIELNHLFNLVPATWEINVLKGNKLYDVQHAIIILYRAKDKASKIKKRIEELKTFKDFEKYLAMISSYITNSKDPRQELSKITELLPNHFGPFEKKRVVLERQYTRSESSVNLVASLPMLYEQCGECCFEFRSIFISDCMITLSHKQITQQLLVGINTDYKLGKRGFISGRHFQLPNLYYIQLGNNRFTLKDDEVEELCKIVDDFGQVYVDRFHFVENSWSTLCFRNFNPYECSVKLIEIKRSLWKKMIEFSWEFDFSNGNSEWHIFNSSNGTIMLYPNRIILTKVEPEKGTSYHYESYMNSGDKLWIRWKRYENHFQKDEESWSAEQTYQWLLEKFIPYVIYYYDYVKTKKYWFEKIPSFEFFCEKFRIGEFILNSGFENKKSFKLIDNVDELLLEIYSLQMFFNMSQNICVSIEETRNIYQGLKYILLNIDLPEYSYRYINDQITGNDNDKHSETDVIKLINQKIKFITENDTSSFCIEKLFKCYIEALKYERVSCNLKKSVIKEVIVLLKSVWKKYYLVEYIKRIGREEDDN